MDAHNSTHEEERELIAALRGGDAGDYVHLMRRYGPQVLALVARLVDDPLDAEELAQDAFVKAFRNLRQYDADKASFGTWLMRIAYHETLNYVRRRKPTTVYLSDCPQADDADEETNEWDDRLATGDDRCVQCLERCIGQLPVEERALLILYYYENRPLSEIGGIVGLKPSVLASRLFRIRRKLCGWVEKELKKTGKP